MMDAGSTSETSVNFYASCRQLFKKLNILPLASEFFKEEFQTTVIHTSTI
jgi:hypothetical protein